MRTLIDHFEINSHSNAFDLINWKFLRKSNCTEHAIATVANRKYSTTKIVQAFAVTLLFVTVLLRQ